MIIPLRKAGPLARLMLAVRRRRSRKRTTAPHPTAGATAGISNKLQMEIGDPVFGWPQPLEAVRYP